MAITNLSESDVLNNPLAGASTSLLTAGVNALGTGYAANQAAGAQNSLAQQQLTLGQQAANAAQFRPVGVTSRFGTSGFQYDQAGNLVGAGYQVAPDIAAMREGLIRLAGQGLTNATTAQGYQPGINKAAEGLFKLGQNYIATTPETAASNWMKAQQQLLAPGREQQLAQLQNQQFQQGRGGLAVGATNAGYTTGPGAQGLAATNPQLAAYYNAMAQQDATLAAQAQQQGQAQTTFGQGLMSGGINLANQGYGMQTAALAPYNQYIAGAASAEALGQNPFDLSTALGSKQATAGSQVASILNSAANQAAASQQQGINYNTAATTGAVSGGIDAVNALLRSWANPSSISGPSRSVSTYDPATVEF